MLNKRKQGLKNMEYELKMEMINTVKEQNGKLTLNDYDEITRIVKEEIKNVDTKKCYINIKNIAKVAAILYLINKTGMLAINTYDIFYGEPMKRINFLKPFFGKDNMVDLKDITYKYQLLSELRFGGKELLVKNIKDVVKAFIVYKVI